MNRTININRNVFTCLFPQKIYQLWHWFLWSYNYHNYGDYLKPIGWLFKFINAQAFKWRISSVRKSMWTIQLFNKKWSRIHDPISGKLTERQTRGWGRFHPNLTVWIYGVGIENDGVHREFQITTRKKRITRCILEVIHQLFQFMLDWYFWKVHH